MPKGGAIKIINGEFDGPDEQQAEELNRKFAYIEDSLEEDEPPKRRFLLLKILAFIVAFLFLFSMLARHLQVLTWPAFDFLRESAQLLDDSRVQDLREAVVEINVTGGDGILPAGQRGSGFNIHPDGLVVTNRHVVDVDGGVEVSFRRWGVHRSVERVISQEADLALVKLDGKDLPVVETSESGLPSVGERVMVIGNPMGYTGVAVEGAVSDYRQSGNITVMEIEAHIHPGSSGSPVFNEEGRVVGVIFATVKDEEKDKVIKGLAVPLFYLEALLEKTV